jgi:hypothetical protein
MRSISRFASIIPAALLFLVAAGCGKTLAPDVGPKVLSDGAGVGAAGSFTGRLKAVGAIVSLDRNFNPHVSRNEAFYVEELAPGESRTDTVPAYATVKKFEWRPAAPGQADDVSERRLGVGAPTEPATATVADPPIGEVLVPGIHEFLVEAPDHAGGGQRAFRLMAGFLPDAWWAGPDPDQWPASSDGDGRAVDVLDWATFTTVPAWPPDGRRYFGPDSFAYIPSVRRPPRDDFEARTFYEIYGDRIYARREGDVVHLNSWIVMVHGGWDKDSPYTPKVDAADPGLPADFASQPDRYPVLQSLGLVGSPIGFRHRLTVKLPDGTIYRPASTNLYPIFDPTSVFRRPQVAGYVKALLPGTTYVVERAQDADGLLSPDIPDPIGLVALVDAGGGSPADRIARRRVLTFRVASPTSAVARIARPE